MEKNNEDEKGFMINLNEKSCANVEFILNKLKEKLQIVNSGEIHPGHFDLDLYEDLLELYWMVDKKSSFSVSEIEAIVSELGKLRKN